MEAAAASSPEEEAAALSASALIARQSSAGVGQLAESAPAAAAPTPGSAVSIRPQVSETVRSLLAATREQNSR